MNDRVEHRPAEWTARARLLVRWVLGAVSVWLLDQDQYRSLNALAAADTFYVVRRFASHVSLALLFLLVAAVYWLLDIRLDNRNRRVLGWGQMGLMFAGAVLVYLPVVFLQSASTPARYAAPERMLLILSTLSQAGYVMIWLGVGLFVVLLADVFTRRITPKRS